MASLESYRPFFLGHFKYQGPSQAFQNLTYNQIREIWISDETDLMLATYHKYKDVFVKASSVEALTWFDNNKEFCELEQSILKNVSASGSKATE